MRQSSELPIVPAELLLGSEPTPPFAGPARLSFASRPERERPTMLRECFGRMGYRYEISQIAGEPFEADLSINVLSDLLVMSGTLHGSCNRRTREMVDGEADDALLMINIAGPHRIEQRNREVVLGDGEAILVSSAQPSSFTHRAPGKLLALRLPRQRLTATLRQSDASFMRRIDRGSPALRLLTHYLSTTWDERAATSPELAALMAGHVYDLTAVMFGPTRDAAEVARSGGLHAARLHLIKQDIADHLDQPGLSVTALANRHHCTPRFIQRLFEAEGSTLTKYVLEQRLSRARQMLGDAGRAHEKISSIAYDCGFGDVSYFNRVFRQHYGAAPSDIRIEALRNGDAVG